MAEGVATRYRLSDAVWGQNERFEALLVSNQKNTEAIARSFELPKTIQKNMNNQQAILANLMNSITRLEKQPESPTLLPAPLPLQPIVHNTPVSSSIPRSSSVPELSYKATPKFPKLKVS